MGQVAVRATTTSPWTDQARAAVVRALASETDAVRCRVLAALESDYTALAVQELRRHKQYEYLQQQCFTKF